MSTESEIKEIELRIRQLRAKIKLRESQQGLETAGSAHGRHPQFDASLRYELRQACATLVTLKYDPVAVVERMEGHG
ncbi:MAG: hypothetical protein ACRD3Q_08060 [Terriglobales bacterium]